MTVTNPGVPGVGNANRSVRSATLCDVVTGPSMWSLAKTGKVTNIPRKKHFEILIWEIRKIIPLHPDPLKRLQYRPMRRVLLAFGVSLAVIIASMSEAASPLSAPERKLAALVDAHNAEAEALLERAVNVNSGTMNFEGVREV